MRPDASSFVANCVNCCDIDDATDCQFNEAVSLLDIIISDIDSLATFEETCCAELHSKIDEILNCTCCQHIITQADIDTGVYTITSQGVYCLASDVTFTVGNAITIDNTASDVILDLQGYTITGSFDAVNAILVSSATGGATIRNGSISGGVNGINIVTSTNVFIENVRIYSPTSYGIQVFQSIVTIDGVAVSGAGVDGMYFAIGVFSLIQNSEIHGSGAVGLHIDGAFSCNVTNVSVFQSGTYNYLVESVTAPTAGVSYKGCVSEFSGLDGYFIAAGPVGISYSDCTHFFAQNGNGFTVAANGGDNFLYTRCSSVAGINGFATDTASNTVVYDACSAERNSNDGYSIACQTAMIRDSFASRNDNNGISLLPTSVQCQVIHSSALSNNNIGIEDLGTNNSVYSNTATSNGVANYNGTVPLQLKPTDITGYWINVDSNASVVGEYESKIDAILDCSCCQNMITQEMINSGMVIITNPGIYCLASDIEFSGSGIAIQINNINSDVILDLGGHTITSLGLGTAIAVIGATGGTIIRNGIFNGGSVAIIITNGSKRVVIDNNTIFATANYGIWVQNQSSDVTIENLIITDAGSAGIYFSETDTFTNFSYIVRNAVITNTSDSGIHINGMNIGLFENIRSINNLRFGFMVEAQSDASHAITFKNCHAEHNTLSGFYVTSNGNDIDTIVYDDCSSIYNQGAGFLLEPVLDRIQTVEFKNCTAAHNASDGFATGVGSSGAQVSDIIYQECTSQSNIANGFFIDCYRSLMKNCTAVGNDSCGVRVDTVSFDCQVIDTSITANIAAGIQIAGSNALLQHCTVGGNFNDGIVIFGGANNNQIVQCYVVNNAGTGINDAGAATAVHGNYAGFNGADYSGGITNFPASETITYWGNVTP